MRNEHSEIMHSITNIERRFDHLERENQYFRSILQPKATVETTYSGYNKRNLTIEETEDNNEMYLPRTYIGENYPKTHINSESRCMPFKPTGPNLKPCLSSDQLNTSDYSSQKGITIEVDRPARKRFLIPKPDSRQTADFYTSHNL